MVSATEISIGSARSAAPSKVVHVARAAVLVGLTALIAADQDSIAVVLGAMFLLGTTETFADTTATLTNLGEHTADTVQPVIYPPQVAIVGCGQIAERAWAHEGALSVRRAMTVTVGGDHRVSDGRSASKFLTRLDELLQHPEQL